MAKIGRPSKYDPACLGKVREMGALGATHREIAETLGINEDTLYCWKRENREFSEALKVGSEAADDRVEQSLYRRATGYTFDSVKVFNASGTPLVVPVQEHVPPDPTAAIFWLKNRRREQWRDKLDHEHTGKDGAPLVPVLNVTIAGAKS